jgi:circadian clock protein KaiC
VETVLLLRYVELRSQIYRLLSIMKMRESRYDTSLREFRIEPEGLDLAESFESAEVILSGHGRLREGARGKQSTRKKKPAGKRTGRTSRERGRRR